VNLPIDQAIDAAHAAAERIESDARAIEARIIAAGGLPPVRPYGRPVDPEAVARNLTLRSVLQRRDAPLAAFLGVGSDHHIKAREAAEARQASAARMAEATAALREHNQQQRQAREAAIRAGVQPLTRRRLGT